MINQETLITYAKYGLETLIKENENAALLAKHYGEDKEAEKIKESIEKFKNDLKELTE